jgi:N-acetylglucosamine-6-phosphate deacetylase
MARTSLPAKVTADLATQPSAVNDSKVPNVPVVFHSGTLILKDRLVGDGQIVARDGLIEYVGKRRARRIRDAIDVDARGGFLCPGFVDIHVHGGGNADFMDGTLESVQAAIHCHARHGTTTLFPTTTTGSPSEIQAMLRSVEQAKAQWQPSHGSRIAGVHLYGPYFAPDKVGCHSQAGRRSPERLEYDAYFATRLISIATCAAELPGADEFYRTAKKYRCLITCGHSNASWSEMQRAYRYGMRHVDHFWCAMNSVSSLRARLGTPMQASMEQFVLAHPEMSTEVIADGCHLANELLEFAYRFKGPDRLCLVTDSSRALDMPIGRYRFGNVHTGTEFYHDGQVGRTLDASGLASSTAGMDRMLQVMAKATQAPLHEVVRMASLTPAQRTGIDDRCGSLEQGKLADVLILNKRLHLSKTYIQSVPIDAQLN